MEIIYYGSAAGEAASSCLMDHIASHDSACTRGAKIFSWEARPNPEALRGLQIIASLFIVEGLSPIPPGVLARGSASRFGAFNLTARPELSYVYLPRVQDHVAGQKGLAIQARIKRPRCRPNEAVVSR